MAYVTKRPLIYCEVHDLVLLTDTVQKELDYSAMDQVLNFTQDARTNPGQIIFVSLTSTTALRTFLRQDAIMFSAHRV